MKKAIHTFLRYGTIISTVALIVSVLIQIYARFLLPNAPAWTEEASRLFFIYTIAFAAGLALEGQEYVHLDYFFEKFPKKVQKYILLVISITMLMLCLSIVFYSIPFIISGHQETAPGMKIRMSYVFFSVFIMAASLSYFAYLELLLVIKKLKS